MGYVINYKKWAIEREIKYLKKQIKRFPDSPETERRKQQIEDLEKDLAELP
jgi:hypothetical protein